VVETVPAAAHSAEEILKVAAALEARSEHPLARAVLAAFPQATPAEEVTAVPGDGLEGLIDGRAARLGRPGFIDAGPLTAEVTRMQQAGATVVLARPLMWR
jgi:cation-transporting ATPase G